MKQDMIVILDLGSSENTTPTREIRALDVYSEIYPYDITKMELQKLPNVKGVILNGGEHRSVDGKDIDILPEIYEAGYPVTTIDHTPTLCEQKLEEWPSEEMLKTFVFTVCKAEASWNTKNFVADQMELIREQMKDRKVLLALSGGVDSSVVAALLLKAIGKQLYCVHVNHGLMRRGESESIIEVFKNQMDANLIYVDASEQLLGKLKDVAEPEQKHKIIGTEFIHVSEEEARKLKGIDFLAQEAIHPDTVESGTKTTKVVKSYRNVGGLPDDLAFELVGPLRQLFKDGIHAYGLELGLPHDVVFRQPFPGPGLGVYCLGAITKDRLEAVRESDAILHEEFATADLDQEVWQCFTIVPDLKSIDVKNNARNFECLVILRAVNAIDAMAASIKDIDWPVLHRITDRILKEAANVDYVCYNSTPKPCGTIEWE